MPQKARMLSDKMKEMERKPGRGNVPLLVHSDLTVADEALRPISGQLFPVSENFPERSSLPQLLVQNNVTEAP